jgi:hypothetical protein
MRTRLFLAENHPVRPDTLLAKDRDVRQNDSRQRFAAALTCCQTLKKLPPITLPVSASL